MTMTIIHKTLYPTSSYRFFNPIIMKRCYCIARSANTAPLLTTGISSQLFQQAYSLTYQEQQQQQQVQLQQRRQYNRRYSTTTPIYHYKYPDGPGHYGDASTNNTTSVPSMSHDHSHAHSHSHSHHHDEIVTERQHQQHQQLQSFEPSESSEPSVLITDANTVKYWNQTTMNQAVEYHIPNSTQYRKVEEYPKRAYTIGIGGPVGSGKTATVLALCKALPAIAKQMMMHHNRTDYTLEMGVVTNDIFTQEDAEFLIRHSALTSSENSKNGNRIVPVETGGCPHTAIREDISSNVSALTQVTRTIQKDYMDNAVTKDVQPNILLLCESGGDNLAANFSNELVDLTIYVIDVAGGDKIPRKGGPGITQSHLLVINKIDLATAVGSNLHIMYQDAIRMRTPKQQPVQQQQQQQSSSQAPLFSPPIIGGINMNNNPYYGPLLFTSVKHNIGVKEIGQFILHHYFHHTKQLQL